MKAFLVLLFCLCGSASQAGLPALYEPVETSIEVPPLSVSCSVLAKRIQYRNLRRGEKARVIRGALGRGKLSRAEANELLRMAQRRNSENERDWKTELPFVIRWKFSESDASSLDGALANGLQEHRQLVRAGYFDWNLESGTLPDELNLSWEKTTLVLKFTMPLTDYCFGTKGADVEIGPTDQPLVKLSTILNPSPDPLSGD